MNILDQILKDLRRGENLDLYATLVASVILIVANVLGRIPSEYVSSALLTVLTLVSITILGNRHRLEEILDGTNPERLTPKFLEEFPLNFTDKLDAAHELWLVGTHHSSALNAFHSLLQRKLERGGRLRVLLLKPDGAASLMVTMRFPGKVTSDQERNRITSSLSILQGLRELAPDRVEIRVIDFMVDYTAYFLDPASPGATIYLERYTFKVSGGSRKPKFVYAAGDGRWFEHTKHELEALWASGEDWVPPSSASG